MDKIYITIISILVIIIISLSIYILIKSGIYKNMIADLKEENKQLQTQISSAEALIDFQNTKINSYAVNIKMAEEKYKQDISNINEKYSNMHKKYESMEHLSCENILQIIDENQRRFLNEREN
ncbi:MAG: hypothetical protein SPF17_03120 [Candidatus Mucispirillum faecigallinarum]|uniref:Uncharacterized protein n=1 Tax=Candidatus Mucispirillum faecigallinarum TaxID=2838699 RepID=A0A9D2GVI8_9BACT|nr:hypothetical protein [Candidatus Mucispirillum faecigallinarum]HIZ89949.1 hypothetical protein [Candidatus Mucispirillum faecigallinarum]